jgi:hypothetical protein
MPEAIDALAARARLQEADLSGLGASPATAFHAAAAEPAPSAQPGFDIRAGDSLPEIGERLVSNAALLANPAWAPPINLPETLDRARSALEGAQPTAKLAGAADGLDTAWSDTPADLSIAVEPARGGAPAADARTADLPQSPPSPTA